MNLTSRYFIFWLVLGAPVWSGCGDLSGRVGEPEEPVVVTAAPTRGVSALGRIEPRGEIHRISAPTFDGRPSLVKDLLVAEGDWVSKGQLLATLTFQASYRARLAELEAQIPLMEARLRKVNEGPKRGDVAAQQADIARWESLLAIEQADYERFAKLRESEDISASDLDRKLRAVESAEKMLRQSRERLDSLKEIRASDVALAEAGLEAAHASVKRARAELELTSVRSPIRAQVIDIHARPGEEVAAAGLLELAGTDDMGVVAEVYETDVDRVKVGGQVAVSGDILPNELSGVVERIGHQVEKNQVLPLDPTEYADARIVKVHVRLDDSESVASLIHGRVAVEFLP